MRTMVAIEQPDGSVDVLVIQDADVRVTRDSPVMWGARLHPFGAPWRTTVEVTGYGETTHHRARPEWFPAGPDPVEARRAIEGGA